MEILYFFKAIAIAYWPYWIVSTFGLICTMFALSNKGELRRAAALLALVGLMVTGMVITIQWHSEQESEADWQQAVAPLVEQRLPMLDRDVGEITAADVAHALDPCFIRTHRERAKRSDPACRDSERQTRVAVSLADY